MDRSPIAHTTTVIALQRIRLLFKDRSVSAFIFLVIGLLCNACAESGSNDNLVVAIPDAGSSSGGQEVPLAGMNIVVDAGEFAGGAEAGTIAGSMAGTTAGMTAGTTAGMMAGTTAGTTAGMTAGTTAGMMAGSTAGSMAGTTAGSEPPLAPDPNINAGWIGGPCDLDIDCDFDGGICLPDNGGYPRGMCTQECTRFCPDQDGLPVTFCIDGVLMGPGACVQRCDYIVFDDTGCRPGYSCTSRSRSGEPQITYGVCLPTDQVGEPDPVDPPPGSSECLQQLADLGVIFEARGDQREAAGNGLSCEINDAVRVQSPINGVVYRYIESASSTPIYGSCKLMLAVYQLSGLLREYGINEVAHIGTYNCRVIAGTSSISQHGYGDAIDLGSFFTNTGEEYNLVRDWEHNTTNFTTEAARALYEIGQQMYERNIFNIVLTPNYNAAHDNHFHVDLTPGGDFNGKMDAGPHSCGNEHAQAQ